MKDLIRYACDEKQEKNMYNDGRWAPSTLPDEHSAVQCT